jgi:hypothetical protein
MRHKEMGGNKEHLLYSYGRFTGQAVQHTDRRPVTVHKLNQVSSRDTNSALKSDIKTLFAMKAVDAFFTREDKLALASASNTFTHLLLHSRNGASV